MQQEGISDDLWRELLSGQSDSAKAGPVNWREMFRPDESDRHFFYFPSVEALGQNRSVIQEVSKKWLLQFNGKRKFPPRAPKTDGRKVDDRGGARCRIPGESCGARVLLVLVLVRHRPAPLPLVLATTSTSTSTGTSTGNGTSTSTCISPKTGICTSISTRTRPNKGTDIGMTHSQMFQKVESGGGPIFKVVLEC